YAEFNAERKEIFLETPNFSSGAQGMQVADAVIDNTNTVVYGVFNNVDIRSEQRFDELSTEFKQVTLDFTHELTDTLRLAGMIGTTESDHNNPFQTTLLLDWNNIPSMSFDYRGNNRLPVLSYGGPALAPTNIGTPQPAATSTPNSSAADR